MIFLPTGHPLENPIYPSPHLNITCDACGRVFAVPSDIAPGEYRAMCSNCNHVIKVIIKKESV
jgi:predicted Zn finger-like uncharacterized protein